jgi:hypothetical protein
MSAGGTTAASEATPSSALDDALERVTDLEFAPPARFVSHAPMACEALSALGYDVVVDEWARRFEAQLVPAPRARRPEWSSDADWRERLGDGRLLPEWVGFFERAIDDRGADDAVRTWVPRLAPGLSAALYHGVIRTAHAVRSLGATDTAPRRAELARALGSWASWSRGAGAPSDEAGDPETNRLSAGAAEDALTAAAFGARCYVASPSILHLHGVTGAMAVHLLVPFVAEADAGAMVDQLRADHAALYRGVTPAAVDGVGEWDESVEELAATGGDPHEVKLVEACRRGHRAASDPVFVAAARTVVGVG